MLKTLKNKESKVAERMLSSLTASLLPSPSIESVAQQVESGDFREILNEIRHRLKIEQNDYSPAAMASIYKILSTEMSDIALAQANLDNIKMRLGHRGELRSDLYEIRFMKSFEVAEARGIRPNHALEAIRHPNYVEHLLPERFGVESDLTISLFLKSHITAGGREPFSLLVFARRDGYIQEVGHAWRIYDSDIALYDPKSPLNVLKAFIEVYGLLLKVAGTNQSKLLLYNFIEAPPELPLTQILQVEAPAGTYYSQNFFVRRTPLPDLYEIAIAFAIDESRYVADLRRHGLSIRSFEEQGLNLYPQINK